MAKIKRETDYFPDDITTPECDEETRRWFEEGLECPELENVPDELWAI